MSETFDVLTIGAGSGGMAAAKRAASRGAKVGVIENRTVGGTCVARGCMPKKFLVLAARRMREIQAGGPHGLEAEVTRLDWPEVINHEQSVVDDLIDANHDGLVDREGVHLIEGKGRFVGSNEVKVDGDVYEAESIILATGMRPSRPPFDGVEHGMTSDEFLQNPTLPYSIAMVGGGYISVEFASVLDHFGVEVTIFQRPDTLINGHDRTIARALEEQFEDRGITVRTEAEVQSIEKQDRAYVVQFHENGETGRFGADRVLVAAGRSPNTDNLGLEQLGLETEDGYIPVDSSMQTELNHVYAVGDITGDFAFTPVAIAEGKVAGENAVDGVGETVNYEAIPSAVFTDPEVGSVGLTETQADAKYETVTTAKKSFRPYSSVVRREPEETVIKLIYEGSDKRMVGLHVLGPHASEIVQGFAPAMRKGLYQEDLKDFPGIHPTIAEEIFSTKP